VTDLGSSNGTWGNGKGIWASRRLRHGHEIRLGQTKQHLANLCTGVAAGDANRRSKLANAALRRGAVSLTQLRGPESE
jgi:pSer/pThr/pTyr-binding forkhead associated (FHA) protein